MYSYQGIAYYSIVCSGFECVYIKRWIFIVRHFETVWTESTINNKKHTFSLERCPLKLNTDKTESSQWNLGSCCLLNQTIVPSAAVCCTEWMAPFPFLNENVRPRSSTSLLHGKLLPLSYSTAALSFMAVTALLLTFCINISLALTFSEATDACDCSWSTKSGGIWSR